MYYIKEFEEKYNNLVNDFIISIYVEEFGHETSRKELNNQDNSIFINKNGNLWIAFNNKDEIIGTIAVINHSDNNIELKKFYVRQDYRGKGVSKKLYNTALDFCKKKSFNRIFLWTYEKLDKAISFYLKAGFVEIQKERKESGARCFELFL